MLTTIVYISKRHGGVPKCPNFSSKVYQMKADLSDVLTFPAYSIMIAF